MECPFTYQPVPGSMGTGAARPFRPTVGGAGTSQPRPVGRGQPIKTAGRPAGRGYPRQGQVNVIMVDDIQETMNVMTGIL